MRAWRETFSVHPAADVFPMMSDEELAELGEDITENGLRTPVVLWDETWGDANAPQTTRWLLDGRNRLEALERAGMRIPTYSEARMDGRSRRDRKPFDYGEPWNELFGGPSGQVLYTQLDDEELNAANVVIGFNIKRRHLSAAEKARLALKALEAAKDHRRIYEGDGDRHVKGVRGSTKGETGLAADLAGVSKDVAREQRAVLADPELNEKVEKGHLTAIEGGKVLRERKKAANRSPKWEAIARNRDELEQYRREVSGEDREEVNRNRAAVRTQLATSDLRKWREKYEGEAHAALHAVFPDLVAPLPKAGNR